MSASFHRIRHYLGVMLIGKAFEAMVRFARVAIASLLLVGVPIADAVACAGEDLQNGAVHDLVSADAVEHVAMASDDNDEGGAPQGDDQHCVHGHCHHSAMIRSSDQGPAVLVELPIEQARPNTSIAVARIVGGPERPPKA